MNKHNCGASFFEQANDLADGFKINKLLNELEALSAGPCTFLAEEIQWAMRNDSRLHLTSADVVAIATFCGKQVSIVPRCHAPERMQTGCRCNGHASVNGARPDVKEMLVAGNRIPMTEKMHLHARQNGLKPVTLDFSSNGKPEETSWGARGVPPDMHPTTKTPASKDSRHVYL